ncbi:hypothetical protein [Paraburkholderia sp. BCC1886]|uniref:hypothetical protein n=1 Tax=Paraburkholderia sp. BCC1886 TaxID=2562670 RepID=UPI001182267A|nr:hypothetical protein [Paraburkholderia sp. BCC1886]
MAKALQQIAVRLRQLDQWPQRMHRLFFDGVEESCMEKKRRQLFLRRWLWYTFRDAFSQTFGWLTLFGGWFGGFVLVKFGVQMATDQVTSNVVAAVGGFVIGVAVYAVVGLPKRAVECSRLSSRSRTM